MSRRRGPERDANGLTSEDRRIWARVAGTVAPPKVRKAQRVPVAGPEIGKPAEPALSKPRRVVAAEAPPPALDPTPARPTKTRPAPETLEPRRQRRLVRERDPIEARIDLHGFGRFEAEDQLRAFLLGSQARGLRAVLVITGQGRRGGGVIRASFEEWLHAAALRGVVSGFSSAGRRHGGEGAFYVTLKRRT
ncbi:Smr/MutS family protein [uncultured Brevundimonas sp.]|uniref:Smr/MutS family protein n=1 Tax=uncultured Brevundimonas sp. TaxID=213418 RepID=UPI0025D41480|nr:Smr/MutS family protein [uncultured Brevundimonas sp.]